MKINRKEGTGPFVPQSKKSFKMVLPDADQLPKNAGSPNPKVELPTRVLKDLETLAYAIVESSSNVSVDPSEAYTADLQNRVLSRSPQFPARFKKGYEAIMEQIHKEESDNDKPPPGAVII